MGSAHERFCIVTFGLDRNKNCWWKKLKKKIVFLRRKMIAAWTLCKYAHTERGSVDSVEKHESTVIFHVIVRSNYNFDGNQKSKSRRFSGAASMLREASIDESVLCCVCSRKSIKGATTRRNEEAKSKAITRSDNWKIVW